MFALADLAARAVAVFLVSTLPGQAQNTLNPNGSPQLPALPGLPGMTTPVQLPEGGSNPACNADFLPAEGAYDGPQGRLEVIYVDGTDTECPTLIQFRLHHRAGLEIRSAMLGQGGSWSGAGVAILPGQEQSNGIWHLSAQQDPTRSHFTGIDFSRTVWLTGYLAAFPSGEGMTRSYGPFEAVGVRAPECLCNRVRSERRWNARLRELYLDPRIRQYAVDHNLRGSGDDAHYYYRDGQIYAFGTYPDGAGPSTSSACGPNQPSGEACGPLHDMTYEDLIDGFAVEELQFDASGDIVVVDFPVVSGGNGIAAFAETNSRTCDVDPPVLSNVRASCTPAVIYRSAMAHEQQHEALCLQLRDRPSYLNTHGQSSTNSRGALYAFSTQDPVSAGNDEAAAYAAGLRVIDAWLQDNCEG